ncbi:hypothetical protein ABMA28_010309 [Loxostege sticticalis]|uniref:Uncharacterized protein n=1 Tax=Loxostege sticticalis TaxID=481309 RepID=A0ABD0SAD4_LOXSC
MLTTVVLLTVLALVQSHDVKVGNNAEGRKIFDEVRHASPTIWRQTENITINTTDAEVISSVVITDLRPDKDGDAKIVEGGEGQKNVTIELKSPTVLRGYDFQIEVYAVPENDQAKVFEDKKEDIPTAPGQVRKQRNPEEYLRNGKPSLLPAQFPKFDDEKKLSTTDKNGPGSITSDTKVNDDATKKTDGNAEKVDDDKLKIGSAAADKGTNNPTASANEEVTTNSNDHSRHGRDATSEAPQNVSEQNTPKEKDSGKYSTVSPLNYNGFVTHPGIDEEKRNARDVTKNVNDETQPPILINEESKTVDPKAFSTSTTAKSVTEETERPKINVPFRRPQYPVPYPTIRGTVPSASTTTEKSQSKRETDLKNTETTQHEEKEDNKNGPRFLAEQNSTFSQQKPVISIQ